MSKKLLLMCSRTFPGSLKVHTNLKGVLRDKISADIVPIEDFLILSRQTGIRGVDRRLTKWQTSLNLVNVEKLAEYGNNILFAGWGPVYDVVLAKLNKKGITPSLIMCSTPGQAELAGHELVSYQRIIDYVKKGKIRYWLLNRRLYASIGQVIKQAVDFPHTVDLDQFEGVKSTQLGGRNIDLFCKPRPGKNILNQVLGFKISGVKASLHVNFRDRLVDDIIDTIDVKIVRHGWFGEKEYYSFVAGMDLSLQATFTESFNYAIAERMCLGVPVLTSSDIYFTADDSFLSRYLCVRALDTPSEIAHLIKVIMDDNKLRRELGAKCKEVMEKLVNKKNAEAIDFILKNFT